jgi:hypothetical protein
VRPLRFASLGRRVDLFAAASLASSSGGFNKKSTLGERPNSDNSLGSENVDTPVERSAVGCGFLTCFQLNKLRAPILRGIDSAIEYRVALRITASSYHRGGDILWKSISNSHYLSKLQRSVGGPSET